MVKRSVVMAIVMLVVLALAGSAMAISKDELVKFTEDAAKHAKQVGKEAALKDFSDSKGKFVKGEVYVFAFDYKGLCIAHGTNPQLIGKNFVDMKIKDSNGKAFIEEMIEVAKKGKGFVDYNWTNPETKKVQPKESYVIKIDDTYWIAAGRYK